MILVFYIVLAIVLGISILALILYWSQIEISIKNLYMNSGNKKENNDNILITISLKLGKYKWLKFKMNKNKMANVYVKIKKMEYENSNIKNKIERTVKETIKDKRAIGLISNLKINLQELKTEIFLGTENPIITSYLVAFTAIIISNILPHISNKTSETIKYKVLPIYKQRNMYSIKLNSTLSIKIANIIKILWKLRKITKTKRDNHKYENIGNIQKRNVQTV